MSSLHHLHSLREGGGKSLCLQETAIPVLLLGESRCPMLCEEEEQSWLGWVRSWSSPGCCPARGHLGPGWPEREPGSGRDSGHGFWKAWNCQILAAMEGLELSGLCTYGQSGIVRSLQLWAVWNCQVFAGHPRNISSIKCLALPKNTCSATSVSHHTHGGTSLQKLMAHGTEPAKRDMVAFQCAGLSCGPLFCSSLLQTQWLRNGKRFNHFIKHSEVFSKDFEHTFNGSKAF